MAVGVILGVGVVLVLVIVVVVVLLRVARHKKLQRQTDATDTGAMGYLNTAYGCTGMYVNGSEPQEVSHAPH